MPGALLARDVRLRSPDWDDPPRRLDTQDLRLERLRADDRRRQEGAVVTLRAVFDYETGRSPLLINTQEELAELIGRVITLSEGETVSSIVELGVNDDNPYAFPRSRQASVRSPDSSTNCGIRPGPHSPSRTSAGPCCSTTRHTHRKSPPTTSCRSRPCVPCSRPTSTTADPSRRTSRVFKWSRTEHEQQPPRALRRQLRPNVRAPVAMIGNRGSEQRWRWDLNPRRLSPHTLSRRAPSAARTRHR